MSSECAPKIRLWSRSEVLPDALQHHAVHCTCRLSPSHAQPHPSQREGEKLFFFFLKEHSESWLIIQILDWGHALLKKNKSPWEMRKYSTSCTCFKRRRSSGVQYNNTCFLETWSEVLNANWEANFVALAATTKVSQVPCSMLSYTRTMPLQKYKMEEVRGLCSMLLRWTAGLWNIWRA